MKLRHLATCVALLAPAADAPSATAQQVVDAIRARTPRVQPTVELAPTSAWQADFAADSCALTRTFGDGEASVTLRLRQFAPQADLEVTLASSTLELRPDHPTYAFAGGEMRAVEFFQSFRTDVVRGVIFDAWSPGPSETVAPAATDDPAMRAVDRLTVHNVFDRGLVLRTGSLERPLRVLATCLDDLLTGWGLDAVAHHSLTRPVTEKRPDRVWPGVFDNPIPLIGRWPSDKMDYILLVSETGTVTGCRLVGGLPEDSELAENICAAMPSGWVFDPALDANGNAIKSFHRATFLKSTRTTVSGVQ